MLVPALPSIMFAPALRHFSEYFFLLFQSPLFRLSYHSHHFSKCFISLIEQNLSVPMPMPWAYKEGSVLSLISFSMHSLWLYFLIFFVFSTIVKRVFFVVDPFLCTGYRHIHGFCKHKGSCCCLFFLKCSQDAKTFQNMILSVWNVLMLFHL